MAKSKRRSITPKGLMMGKGGMTNKKMKKILVAMLFLASMVMNIVIYSGLKDGTLVNRSEIEDPVTNTKFIVETVNDQVVTYNWILLVLNVVRILLGENALLNTMPLMGNVLVILVNYIDVGIISLVKLVTTVAFLNMITNVLGVVTVYLKMQQRFVHIYNLLVLAVAVVAVFTDVINF